MLPKQCYFFLTWNFSAIIEVTNDWNSWPPGDLHVHVWVGRLSILVFLCCGISHFKKQGMLNNKHTSELFKCKCTLLNANELRSEVSAADTIFSTTNSSTIPALTSRQRVSQYQWTNNRGPPCSRNNCFKLF